MLPSGPTYSGDRLLSFIGNIASPIWGGSALSPAAGEYLVAGLLYLVICTEAFPDGELRVHLTAFGVEAGGSAE